jgi:hypothetical protein
MIKLPEKVKIGGHWYKVIFPYHFKELNKADGQRDGYAMEIRINDRDGSGCQRVDSAIAVTFIHEVFHALDELTGRNYFKDDDGEKYLDCLAEMVYGFLVDNGHLKSEDE